jgi:lipopolysaccharide biosynthesis regulator YciM
MVDMNLFANMLQKSLNEDAKHTGKKMIVKQEGNAVWVESAGDCEIEPVKPIIRNKLRNEWREGFVGRYRCKKCRVWYNAHWAQCPACDGFCTLKEIWIRKWVWKIILRFQSLFRRRNDPHDAKTKQWRKRQGENNENR